MQDIWKSRRKRAKKGQQFAEIFEPREKILSLNLVITHETAVPPYAQARNLGTISCTDWTGGRTIKNIHYNSTRAQVIQDTTN